MYLYSTLNGFIQVLHLFYIRIKNIPLRLTDVAITSRCVRFRTADKHSFGTISHVWVS
jgi:hypothetical protein